MYFGKSRLRKIWLDKCLKSRVLEHPQTDNVENGLKHSCNLNGCTFPIFIKHFEAFNKYCKGKLNTLDVGKTLLQQYTKSQDCLLTHSLLITSIICLNETISRNEFRCNYLKHKKTFSGLFFSFLKSKFNFKQFPKKDDPHR